LKGYIVADEPRASQLIKVKQMTQALHELDHSRPSMPILIGLPSVGPIFLAAQPNVMLIDVYPAGYKNPIGDFRMTGFGYDDLDFVDYIRAVTLAKPARTPLWVILQTHSFEQSLRAPTPAEVSAQQWLAIGEGATGIFWFVYSSQQGWKGLADSPALYREVAAQADRLRPLRGLLLQARKIDDLFSAAGGQNPYASTLVSADGATLYVLAVNRDCQQSQQLRIGSPVLRGRLKDIETSQLYRLGAPIAFGPGDGKIFEFIPDSAQRVLR